MTTAHLELLLHAIRAALAIGFIMIGSLLYDPTDPNLRFEGIVAWVCAGALWLPWLLSRLLRMRHQLSKAGRGILDSNWMILLLGNGLGAIYFYSHNRYYDMMLHFLFPIIGGMMLAIAVGGLNQARGWKLGSHLRWIPAMLSGAVVLAWEVFEYTGDQLWQTNMLGQFGAPLDTVNDIAVGLIGVLILTQLVTPLLKLCLKQTTSTNT